MIANDRTSLYRHYDRNEQLLYIGVSLCPFARLGSHKHRNVDWYEAITRIEIEWFDNKARAHAAESAAIANEKPLYNQRPGPITYLTRKDRELREKARVT